MGWTTGELVTLYETVLFVEGVNDERVLQGLFATELRAAGILVTPIHGLRKIRGIPHSRLLTELVPGLGHAMMVDSVQQPLIDQLFALDDEDLAGRARKPSDELGYVAQLLCELSRERRSRLQVVSHGAPDIIALLDDELLGAELPRYPGAAAVQDAITRLREAGKATTWKRYMRDKCALPGGADEDRLVQRVVESMASRGIKPQALADLIAHVATGAAQAGAR